jgi:hypothetical protein
MAAAAAQAVQQLSALPQTYARAMARQFVCFVSTTI